MEFFSILIAVVLGMSLTEWRQTFLNHRQAKESFQNIIEEIQDNYEELLGDSVDVKKNVDDLEAWIRVESDRKDTLDLSVNFRLSFMSNSAFDVAKLNQSLTFLDNEKVLELSDVYETQEFYEKAAGDVFDPMIAMIKMEDSNSKRYREELIAFRYKVGLAYSGIVTYLRVARRFLDEYASTSAPTEQ